MIFQHCFPGLQLHDDGSTTDATSGQKSELYQSDPFADDSWIEVNYETAKDPKGDFDVQYVVHSPPPAP